MIAKDINKNGEVSKEEKVMGYPSLRLSHSLY